MINRIIYALWLFLAIATFSSCNNADYAVKSINYLESDEVDESDGIKISDPMFLKISRFNFNNEKFGWGPHFVNNFFTFGDTMAVGCRVENPNWNNTSSYENKDKPIDPPIVARVTSSETGDVQCITFSQDIVALGSVDLLGTENVSPMAMYSLYFAS